MDREEATQRIRELVGQDLRPLAEKYGITVFRQGRPNKGWAGHVIERHLGLPLNSAQAPNFGSWELKVVPLARRANGVLRVKETMAITMIDPVEVVAKSFLDSHLFAKLRKILIVSRIFQDRQETSSIVRAVGSFDLGDQEIRAAVEKDYELIRRVLLEKGASGLSGKLGTLVQPRTKGPGHGSTSRAFYARTGFVAHILGLSDLGGQHDH